MSKKEGFIENEQLTIRVTRYYRYILFDFQGKKKRRKRNKDKSDKVQTEQRRRWENDSSMRLSR